MGGSVISDKKKPFSIRLKIIDQIISQISKYIELNNDSNFILIHGGGSFGHPLAKKYGLAGGFNQNFDNQIYGFAETHNAMVKLNSTIIDKFLAAKIPILSLQTSVLFEINQNDEILFNNINLRKIQSCLDKNLIPILYGDIIFNEQIGFSILSGDRIITELCKSLSSRRISEVIFMIEEDGLITQDGLIKYIRTSNLDSLQLKVFEDKIDITGGIYGKLSQIKKILDFGIPISIINGLKPDFLLKCLLHQDFPHTIFEN